jgi:hypothetical protein
MSGPPSSYSSPSSNGGQNGGSDECRPYYRGVRLTSPKMDVLAGLQVNDTLDLLVGEAKGRPVLFATHNGSVAGTVTSQSAGQIIRCIQEGHKYIAIIKSLDGGDCLLEIRMENG